MNQTTLAVALLAVVASAAPGGGHRKNVPQGKLGQDPEFQNYAAKFNKNFKSTGDFEARHENYLKLDKVVRETNRKADLSTRKDPLRLGHNRFSDMSHDEYMSLLGFDGQKAEEDVAKNGRGNGNGNGNGRHLQTTRATSVDWASDGYVGPVKDQGDCGSCWAFAANTALEAAKAIKYNQTPERLSEQELVSCASSYGVSGCDGGLMHPAWNYFNDNGTMTNANYPYISGDTEQNEVCNRNAALAEPNTNAWSWVAENTEAVKAAVDIRPVTIAIDASSYVFQAYKSGVIRDEDNCGDGFNHAVVIVGYTDGGSVNPNPAPEPTPPEPTPEPTPPEPTPEPVESSCQVTRWWHKCTDPNARRLQDANGDDRYFLVQNSWGVGWGDAGFVRFGMSDVGDGVCRMNYYVQNVEWTS